MAQTLNTKSDSTSLLLGDNIVSGDIHLGSANTNGTIHMQGHAFPDSEHIISTFSTGLYNGGLMTESTPTSVDVSAGNGLIMDSHTDPDNPVHLDISWDTIIGEEIQNIGNGFSHIFMTSAGTILQTITEPNVLERRNNIYLGKIIHLDFISIIQVSNQPEVCINTNSQSHDFWRGLGPIILSGNRINANGTNLSIDKSAGNYHQSGVGFNTAHESANIITIPSNILATVNIAYRFGLVTVSSVLIPINFDDGGIVTAIPGSNNRATNQRVYLFNSNNIGVLYGQQWYQSLAEAKIALVSEPFVVEPISATNAVLVAVISVIKGATDLSNPLHASIHNASKFGEISMGVGGAATSTLQSSYDNSTTPEIIVDSTRGAVTVMDNATPIGANLFEVQTNSSTNIVEVAIDGVDITGDLAVTDSITIGSKGLVTQITSSTTGVTINSSVGTITTVSLAIPRNGKRTFTVTNSYVLATSVIFVNVSNYTGDSGVSLSVSNILAGSAQITMHNIGADTLTDVCKINFVVL